MFPLHRNSQQSGDRKGSTYISPLDEAAGALRWPPDEEVAALFLGGAWLLPRDASRERPEGGCEALALPAAVREPSQRQVVPFRWGVRQAAKGST